MGRKILVIDGQIGQLGSRRFSANLRFTSRLLTPSHGIILKITMRGAFFYA